MSQADARAVYEAMLERRISDLELGALLIGLRIKGESAAEIAGFLEAAQLSFEPLPAPVGEFAPVVIPSYNGSRQLPNLTPLLALLLAREGVPVLVHGVSEDPGRITSAEIFSELGIAPLKDRAQVGGALAKRVPVFMPISQLAPKIHQLLQLRRVLGLRNSTHTLVKIMQPFNQPVLRLVSYTHPEYLPVLSEYFLTVENQARGDIFLMRGTEGETVANPKRANAVTWFSQGQSTELIERQAPNDTLPVLPTSNDARVTAHWIQQALQGQQPIPAPISEQVAHCLRVAKQLRS